MAQSQEPVNTDTESICEKLTEKEASKIIENGRAVGFVWYNEDVKIIKIVFYDGINYWII